MAGWVALLYSGAGAGQAPPSHVLVSGWVALLYSGAGAGQAPPSHPLLPRDAFRIVSTGSPNIQVG